MQQLILGTGTAIWWLTEPHCLNTNIYFFSETSGGQSSNIYLNVVHFSTPVYVRHLWQLKTICSYIGAKYVLFYWIVKPFL
jgi:hypothetical protein